VAYAAAALVAGGVIAAAATATPLARTLESQDNVNEEAQEGGGDMTSSNTSPKDLGIWTFPHRSGEGARGYGVAADRMVNWQYFCPMLRVAPGHTILLFQTLNANPRTLRVS